MAVPREPGAWTDSAHGHGRRYPSPGVVVRQPPHAARPIVWAGVPYLFHQGVWYGHRGHGHVVVRPPYGAVVSHLPDWRTVVIIGGLAYLYVNGTYYRERHDGAYVVSEPVRPEPAVGAERLYVYPRSGQSADQQAVDEYDCHRWAAGQTGVDPGPVDARRKPAANEPALVEFQRARSACLEGRDYTVR